MGVSTWKLKKELPRYEIGTVFTRQFQTLPSKFNSGTYNTPAQWDQKDSNVALIPGMNEILERIVMDQNIDEFDWFEKL